MSTAGRISSSNIGASARLLLASGTQTVARTPSPAPDMPAASATRRNDGHSRSKIFRMSPQEAIAQCKLKTNDLKSKIGNHMEAGETSDHQIISKLLVPIIPLLAELEEAYEQAASILKNVRGILSSDSNQTFRRALADFLSEQHKAKLARNFYLAFQHSSAASEIMERPAEAVKPDAEECSTGKVVSHSENASHAQALEHYEKAVSMLLQFRRDALHTEHSLPGHGTLTNSELLAAALSEEIGHRERFVEKSLMDIEINIRKLRQQANNARKKIRQEQATSQPAPAPKPGGSWEKALDTKASARKDSKAVLDAIPQAVESCRAALQHNDILLHRLSLEHQLFPDSEENLASLRDAILTSIWIDKGISDFQALNFHELLHYARSSPSLTDQEFAHLNQIHGPIMGLCTFYEHIKRQISSAIAAANHDSIGPMLDYLASQFNSASEQLRFHSLAAFSQESKSPEYQNAASLLEDMADGYFTTSEQAYLAKHKLIDHELISNQAARSKGSTEWQQELPGVDWGTAPSWLLNDSAGIVPEDARKTQGPAISTQGKELTKRKSVAANAVKRQTSEEVKVAAGDLEKRSSEFSKISAKASGDARSRLEQMRNFALSDQHTWKAIESLMKVACENKQKELGCIISGIQRMEPFKSQPDIKKKIAEFNARVKTLRIESSTLARDNMRNTVEAITLKPTDQGMEYLKAHNKIHSVSQPTWVELSHPDDKYRGGKAVNDYLIEYVLTVKADANAPNRQFVLHAHYNEPTPPYGIKPLKSHYKRWDQRGLGSASEGLLPDGSIFKPVYRNRDASIGLEIAYEMLPADRQTPVPRMNTKKR